MNLKRDLKLFFFSEAEARVRLLVLEFSVEIESLVTKSLRAILKVEEPSKSLGNTNSSLSFNQKVNLLLDTRFIAKEDLKKFLVFMAIRNQFMHNLEAKSFIDCMNQLNGQKDFLFKLYPQEGNDEELKIENSWHQLTSDIISSIDGVLIKYLDGRKFTPSDNSKQSN